MVIDYDMPPVPPARPPLAPPMTAEGGLRAPSPPTLEPDLRAGSPGSAGSGAGHSRATAGLPPLSTGPATAPGTGGHRHRGPVLAALAGVAVVALVAWVVFGFGLGPAGSHDRAATSTTRPTPLDVPALRQAVAASVVQVTVTGSSGATASATVSAVVVDTSGVLVTTADAVAGATGVTVRLADGRSGPAQVLGTLPDDDVAVLRIPAVGGLEAAPFGHSSRVAVHDEVVAVGAAARSGASPTSAEGLVTAVGQSLPSGASSSNDVIRTDAPIPSSAVGGALVDHRGEVVGLNVVPPGADPKDGYALGIDAVAPLVTQIEQGHAQDTPASPSLGVSTQDVRGLAPATAAQYGIQTSDGALVVHVAQPSAAASAGLAVGDVITAVDSQPVNDTADLAAAVAAHQAGDQMQVTYARQGQTANVIVTLLARGDTGN